MDAINATWKDGQVVLDGPVDWPEGLRLSIEPAFLQPGQLTGPKDNPVMTPEEIARTLAAMDAFEAIEMTEQEFQGWEAERRARKESEKAHFFEEAEKLRRMWE